MIDRRTFLTGIAATGVFACLPSCGGDSKKHGRTTSTSDGLVTSAIEQLRASPDHLSAGAAAIIASGDFTAAVRFVRDSVAVVPPTRVSDDAVSGVRWGADGTLRAGAG